MYLGRLAKEGVTYIIVITVLIFAVGFTNNKPLPEDTAKFAELKEFLQEFCNRYAEEDLNFFYISPPIRSSNDVEAEYSYAYWMTGNLIITLNLPVRAKTDYHWYRFKAGVDLKKEIVPTQADIGSSTYLTDSRWVERKIIDCLVNGRKVIIRKNAKKPDAGAGK
jgi:hypothetical protein